MHTIMNDAHLRSIEDVGKFLEGNEKMEVVIEGRKEKYGWIGSILLRFRYKRLQKREKGILKRYIGKLTGYSKIQTKRLVRKYFEGKLTYATLAQKRNSFARKYRASDIARLIETDVAHECLSGQATKEILRRESLLRTQYAFGAFFYYDRNSRLYAIFPLFSR